MAIQIKTNEILRSVAPKLDASAKNLPQQMYGEEGLPWGTPFSDVAMVYNTMAAGCR